MDYQLVISIGALAVSVIVAFSRTLDKSLSIREHEEFSKNVNSALAGLKHDFERETDKINRRVELIEQTRPTTGELEARLNKPLSHSPTTPP
jgi:hypothetical protein